MNDVIFFLAIAVMIVGIGGLVTFAFMLIATMGRGNNDRKRVYGRDPKNPSEGSGAARTDS